LRSKATQKRLGWGAYIKKEIQREVLGRKKKTVRAGNSKKRNCQKEKRSRKKDHNWKPG